MQIKEIWGKTNPKTALLTHLIDTGNVAYELLTNSSVSLVTQNLIQDLHLSKENVIILVSYIAAMHDIGKCHPFFQGKDIITENKLKEEKLTQENQGIFRHEYYSKEIIRRILKEKYNKSEDMIDTLSNCVVKHHYKVKGSANNIRLLSSLKIMWKKYQDEIEEQIHKVFSIDNIHIDNLDNIDAISTQILSIIIVADWIASGKYFYYNSEKEKECLNNIDKYSEWSRKVARTAINKVGLRKSKSISQLIKYEEIDAILTEKNLRPIQKEIKNYFTYNCELPKLMIIEATMGEGKTEAALYSASRMGKGERGIYFALPSSATSNQMYKRVLKVYDNLNLTDVNLVHAMSWLVKSEVDEKYSEIGEWLENTRTGMLSSSAVGTVDQAMMSVMQVRFGVLRLLGLVGKVLIIDEIHSYDAYMSGIIEVLLKWCAALRIPVILLSATLQQSTRLKYLEAYMGNKVEKCELSMHYPLITVDTEKKEIKVKDSYIHKEVSIEKKPLLNKLDNIVNILEPVREQGGCVAIVLNTVKEAQALYSEVKRRFVDDKDIKVILFHARFKANRRKKLEDKCISLFGKGAERPKKAILIATQVVEQSLDVDFDWMLSAICPVDLLLQRIGRLHRHENTNRPEWLKRPIFTVLTPEEEDWGMTGKIYAPWILKKTKEVIEDKENIQIPEDMRMLIEQVYSNDISEVNEKEIELWAENIFQNQQKGMQGQSVAFKEPKSYEFGLVSQGYLSLDEDNSENSIAIAKTRFGIPSRNCIFVEYTEVVKKGINLSENVTKEQAEYLLGNSLSIAEYNICLENEFGFPEPIEGQGLLKGCLIYITNNNQYYFKANAKNILKYNIDYEYGLLVERA